MTCLHAALILRKMVDGLLKNGARRQALLKIILALSESPGGVDHLLATLNVALLCSTGGPEVIKLLCMQCVVVSATETKPSSCNSISTASKALIVDGLQKMGTALRFSVVLSSQLLTVIKSCNGEEMTALKNLIDLGGDYQNLYKLVYYDVRLDVKEKILLHISQQATLVVAARRDRKRFEASGGSAIPLDDQSFAPAAKVLRESEANGRNSPARPIASSFCGVFGSEEDESHRRTIEKVLDGSVGLKVLSDIDDTLYSSGGHFPAGVDREFPKHMIYPGCLQFFKALDQSAPAPSWGGHDHTCNLVFLSARPHAYKDLAESKSYETFNRLVKTGRMHAMPTLLPGKIREGLQAMLTVPFVGSRGWRAVGELKAETFSNFKVGPLQQNPIFAGTR